MCSIKNKKTMRVVLIIRKESFLRTVQVMLKREVSATGTKAINLISKTPRVHVYNALNFNFESRLTRNR